MTTEQIQAFITIAKYNNFTKASDILFVSQSNLSRMITAMESELNLQLFIRANRNIRLTPAGRLLYENFSGIYQDIQETIKKAKDVQAGLNGIVRIGILEGTVVNDFMPDLLEYFRHKHSNILIELELFSFKEMIDALYSGYLDLAFSLQFNLSDYPEIEIKVLEETADNIVVPNNSPLFEKDSIELKDFEGQDFIVITPENLPVISKKVTGLFRDHHIAPVYHFAPNLGTAMLWLENGVGSAFLFSRSRLKEDSSLKFFTIESPWKTDFVLGWNKNNTNPSAELFRKKCLEVFQ